MGTENHEAGASTSRVSNTLAKDMLMPAAVVLAGVFIGAGLYFNAPNQISEADLVLDNREQPPASAAKLTITELAEKAGVDREDFGECLLSKRLAGKVQEDVANAIATGGRGTPWSILIGPGGKTYPISGSLPQQAVEKLIELAKIESKLGPSDSDDKKTNLVTPVSEKDNIRGDINAEIKIIEYSDFDCPFCSRFHDTMKSISEKYSDTEVAWVYRHFPLEQLHPNATEVALASECVAELAGNDAFWKFADGYLGS